MLIAYNYHHQLFQPNQANKQLGANQAFQARLELDLDNKDAALDIDHTCHNIHNNTADIQLHGGIERQRKGTETTSWEKKSDRNVQETQSKELLRERGFLYHTYFRDKGKK